jgi:hypothetical protein
MRAKGAALIQQAGRLLCESWSERIWSDGEPIDPSPTIDLAINWCKTRTMTRVRSFFCVDSMRNKTTRFNDLLARKCVDD